MKVEGMDKIRRSLETIIRKAPDLVRGAVLRQAERIMTRSKDEFVPVDDSPLKNSGHVRMASGKKTATAELLFGGTSADYAVVVHEHPSSMDPPSWIGKNVQFSPAGRGPKYLYRPMMEAVPTLARDIAKDINMEDMLK